MQLQFSKFKAQDFPEYKSWYQDEELNRQLGPMDEEWLNAVLTEKDGIQYSIFHNENLVAVVGIKYPMKNYPFYCITDIAVHPQQKRKGIASHIIQQLIQLHPLKKGETWRAYVTPDNKSAQAFFDRMSWQQITPEEEALIDKMLCYIYKPT